MDLPAMVGRYDVIRLLGQGGMGRVLLARDTVLGRQVAIKILRDDLALAPEMREALFARMRHEARAAATVSHPHMVVLHDMGEEPEIGLFLVFEYVAGPTLRDRITEGPLDPFDVARIAREVASALDRAHLAGVIHRDVKPENVLLSENGAKLTDFGLARIPDSTLTRGGAVLGTPAYSAPEALALGEFSPASDEFSLAATLYEALSGHRAFPGDDALAVASRIATEDPAPLRVSGREMPRAAQALLRGMSRDAAKRFASCTELALSLEDALVARDRPTTISELPPSRSTVPPSRRLMNNLVVAAALLTIVGLFLFGRHPPAGERDGASLKEAATNLAVAIEPKRPPPPAASARHADGKPPRASRRDDADGGDDLRSLPLLPASELHPDAALAEGRDASP